MLNLVYRPTYFGDFPFEFETGIMRIYFCPKRLKDLIIDYLRRLKYNEESTYQKTTSGKKQELQIGISYSKIMSSKV